MTTENSVPQPNKPLRVWIITNPPSEPEFHAVQTPEEGAKLINRVAQEQLRDSSIWGNAFGMEEFDGTEWTEWYDDDGNDVDALAESLEVTA